MSRGSAGRSRGSLTSPCPHTIRKTPAHGHHPKVQTRGASKRDWYTSRCTRLAPSLALPCREFLCGLLADPSRRSMPELNQERIANHGQRQGLMAPAGCPLLLPGNGFRFLLSRGLRQLPRPGDLACPAIVRRPPAAAIAGESLPHALPEQASFDVAGIRPDTWFCHSSSLHIQ